MKVECKMKRGRKGAGKKGKGAKTKDDKLARISEDCEEMEEEESSEECEERPNAKSHMSERNAVGRTQAATQNTFPKRGMFDFRMKDSLILNRGDVSSIEELEEDQQNERNKQPDHAGKEAKQITQPTSSEKAITASALMASTPITLPPPEIIRREVAQANVLERFASPPLVIKKNADIPRGRSPTFPYADILNSTPVQHLPFEKPMEPVRIARGDVTDEDSTILTSIW